MTGHSSFITELMYFVNRTQFVKPLNMYTVVYDISGADMFYITLYDYFEVLKFSCELQV